MMTEMDVEGLREGAIYLALSSAQRLKAHNVELVTAIQQLGLRTVVITFNQPSPILKRLYRKAGLDLSSILFIDAVTKYALGSLPDDIDNAVFLNNPRNLTNLSVAISEMLKEFADENTCVLLDCVSNMLIYLSSDEISKFVHFLSSKISILGTSGIFIAVESGLNPLLMSHLTTFTTDIINLDEGMEGL